MSLKPLLVVAALLVPSCDDLRSGFFYDRTDTGTLKGRLIVEWVDQDRFIFQPDPKDPLTFTRKDKEVLQPGMMYTDGGSVPAPLRAIKSYSPWGYAPAFIVHDWLFTMKHCKLPGFEKYDLDKAATIMAEVMKTVMENPKYGGPNKLVHYSMYEGVRSPLAQKYWDTGTCDTPSGLKSDAGPDGARAGRAMARPSPADVSRPRFVIEF